MEFLAQLEALANTEIADSSKRFFKTGPGQYGEGDLFLGIRVPVLHALSRQGVTLNLGELQILLDSKWHEARLLGLMILVLQFEKQLKKSPVEAKVFLDFYLKNTTRINNWDLVDGSAPYIVGPYLLQSGESRAILYHLAKSPLLWERRIAVLGTFAFIRVNDYADIFKLCELLMEDKEDLMHKAMGWMLREVGKRSEESLKVFLEKNSRHMPRTMLRYSVERLTKEERSYFLTDTENANCPTQLPTGHTQGNLRRAASSQGG